MKMRDAALGSPGYSEAETNQNRRQFEIRGEPVESLATGFLTVVDFSHPGGYYFESNGLTSIEAPKQIMCVFLVLPSPE